MAGEAADHQQIMASARGALVRNQAGGRRNGPGRLTVLRRRHALRKLQRMGIAAAAIVIVATIVGVAIDGIGIGGLFLTLIALIGTLVVLAQFPRMKVPTLASLGHADPETMITRTQLWLDAQRRALPAPSARQLDAIGVQLDGLGQQIAGLDPATAEVAEVRRLVSEHLPVMVDSYRRIPARLRAETQGGRSANQTLEEGLTTISREIDEIARNLAQGDLDTLAVRERFLDTRYGAGFEDTPAIAPPKSAPNREP